MKRILTLTLTLALLLSLTACGGKTDPDTTDVTLSAQEVLDSLRKTLGDSDPCDAAVDEDYLVNYYGLDREKIESWAAESSSNSALDPSSAVILQVKDGYAQEAAAALPEGFSQVLSYARMYDMQVAKVEEARLFVNGNYVALLILGAEGDWEADAETQAQFAADEAAKVDAAWEAIFGSAENSIVLTEDNGSGGLMG